MYVFILFQWLQVPGVIVNSFYASLIKSVFPWNNVAINIQTVLTDQMKETVSTVRLSCSILRTHCTLTYNSLINPND